MKIGEKVRKARENRELSREYLAKVLDLDVRTIGKIENDERDLGFREARLIAKALGITPQQLLFGEPRLVFDTLSQNEEKEMHDNAGIPHHSLNQQIIKTQEQLAASLKQELQSKDKIIALLENRIRELSGSDKKGD